MLLPFLSKISIIRTLFFVAIIFSSVKGGLAQEGDRKSNDSADLYSACVNHECYLNSQYTPYDVLGKIVLMIEDSHDFNGMRLVSNVFYRVIEYLFEITNKNANHEPWHVQTPMTSFLLNHYNTAVQEILGLYVNIKFGWSEESDKVRFNKRCAKFEKFPFAASKPIFNDYVKLLIIDVNQGSSCKEAEPGYKSLLKCRGMFHPVVGIETYEIIESKIGYTNDGTYNQELIDMIGHRLQPQLQNEVALVTYFHLFNGRNIDHVRIISDDYDVYRNKDPFVFEHWTSSIMKGVLNEKLWELKLVAAKGVNSELELARTWEEILRLETGKTVWQQNVAALAMEQASRSLSESGRYQEAAEYIKKEINLQQTPSSLNYHRLSRELHKAGNYQEACKAQEQEMAALLKEGKNLTSENYVNSLEAFYRVGNYQKVVEYGEKALKKAQEAGQDLDDYVYSTIAIAYESLGNREQAKYYENLEAELKKKMQNQGN